MSYRFAIGHLSANIHSRQNACQISAANCCCSWAVNRGSRRSISSATLAGNGFPRPRLVAPTPRFSHQRQPFARRISAARARSVCDTAMMVLDVWIKKSIASSPTSIFRATKGYTKIYFTKIQIGLQKASSPQKRHPRPHGRSAASGVRSPLSAPPQIQFPCEVVRFPSSINSASGKGGGCGCGQTFAHNFGVRGQ